MKQAGAELGQAQPKLRLRLIRSVHSPNGLFLGLRIGSKAVTGPALEHKQLSFRKGRGMVKYNKIK